jgi:hypothetical protein
MKRGAKFYGDAKWRDSFNKAKEQHAVDQMVFGSTLLRPPQDRAQADFYRRNDVLCTSSGEYFTTLTPVPACLESHVIGTKTNPRRDTINRADLTETMKPTASWRSNLSVLAADPARGLSLSR